MKQRVNHIWHDDWILGNLFKYKNYNEAAMSYRNAFSIDICMPAFKNHCIYKLGLKKERTNYRRISKEQSDWVKDIYPVTGAKETARLWNERYGDNLSVTCIKQIAKRLDITVNHDVAVSNRLKAAHGKGSKRAMRMPGETRMECGRMVMKAKDGTWQSAGRVVWENANGKIPDGYALIALDGDTTNINLNNLEIAPWNYLGKLQRNHFFSSDPEITKTGIIWCDLDTVLCEQREKHTY